MLQSEPSAVESAELRHKNELLKYLPKSFQILTQFVLNKETVEKDADRERGT